MRVTVPSPAFDDPHRVAHGDAARVVADRDRVALRLTGLRVEAGHRVVAEVRHPDRVVAGRDVERARADLDRRPLTWPVSRSMPRDGAVAGVGDPHEPSVTAKDSGARPTGIRFAVPSSSIRSTASSPDATTHRIPSSATTRAVGLAAGGQRLAQAVVVGVDLEQAAGGRVGHPDHGALVVDGDAVRAAPGADRLRHGRLLAGRRRRGGRGGRRGLGPRDERGHGLDLGGRQPAANAGIPPSPLVTICCTRSALGLASSRFGPDAPDEPAAASVWQPPQPADAKTALPAGAAPAGGRGAGGLLVGADQRRAGEQQQRPRALRPPTSAARGCGRSCASTTERGTRCWR